MNIIFHGPIAGELHGFLEFKRNLGSDTDARSLR